MSDELAWLGTSRGDGYFRFHSDWGFPRAQKNAGGGTKAHAPADVADLMLLDLLIFELILVCGGVCFWFLIRLLAPVVWDADIKPLIDRMLGPRR